MAKMTLFRYTGLNDKHPEVSARWTTLRSWTTVGYKASDKVDTYTEEIELYVTSKFCISAARRDGSLTPHCVVQRASVPVHRVLLAWWTPLANL